MSTVIKIVGQITLKALTDVKSTTYYYLLQSSMAAAPSKPTTNPPTGGWSTTEPEFFIYMPTQDTTIISGKDYYTRSGEEGSYIYTKVLEPSIDDISNYYEKIYGDTRSLYVTVQTLYTDDTFDYSEPSLSSSYEAAKEAYNRAKTALDLAGDTNQYFWSLSSSYSTDVPAGVYVTHIPQSQFKSTPAQGNVLMQNTGLTIRNGAIALASLTGNALNFYSPTTHNSAVQLSGQALNFYSPSDDRLALSLDSSGLNFYGSSTVNPDASLTLNGLMLKKGGIKAGTDRDNGFVYLSSEDYQLKDATHNGLTINGHTPTAAGTDGKTVSDPAWREIIGTKFAVDSDGNLYANNVDISGKIIATEGQIGGWNIGTDTNKSLFYGNQVPGAASNNLVISSNSAENTIPIAGSDINKHWFLSAGTKFGVDSEGNLYANNANLSNATVEGAITATSLTIGSGSDSYNAINAMNAAGYTIEIINDITAAPDNVVINDNSTYLYPIMYHNGIKVESADIINTQYIWYRGSDVIGIQGDSSNGGMVADYGYTYRVAYSFDDGEVGQAPSVQQVLVDPSKYITRISDTGITIHPEDTSENNYLQIDGNGITIYKNTDSVAQFGTTARIGRINNSRFLINNNSLQAYSGTDMTPYFEVNSTGLSWGNNVAATTAQVNAAALVADNYLTNITGGGVYIHSADTPSDASSANAKGIQISDNLDIIRNGVSIASYGTEVRIGDENEIHIIIDNNSLDIKDSDGLGLATFGNDYLSIGAVPTDSYETLLGKKWAIIDSNGFKVQGKAEFAPFRTYLLGGIAESAAQKMAEYIDEDVNTLWSHYLSCAPISGTTITILFSPTGSTSFTAGVAKTEGGIIYDGVRTFQNTTGTSSGEPDESGLVPAGWEHVASGRVTYVTYESSEATAGTYIFVGVHNDQYQHGDGSAIFGTNLIGQKECQTVIGRYNNNSTSNVFEIGNGSSSTRSNALTVNWNGNTTIAGTLTQSSDRRLKNHKSYLSNDAIEFIRELKPAYFIKDEQSHVGFYAQDVEEIDSWGCMVGEMNGYKTLGYTELIAPLVTYCQHLEKRIVELESQLEGGGN